MEDQPPSTPSNSNTTTNFPSTTTFYRTPARMLDKNDSYQHHQGPPTSFTRMGAGDAPLDLETTSNTLLNSLSIDDRQPKFTEEWDASVRGSSIIDGPNSRVHAYQLQQQRPAMQRSASVSSRRSGSGGDGTIPDGASAHSISLSRGNTLKKKNSLRRGGSLKRSGSRRTMKAGSVRSLALQSSQGGESAEDMHHVFFCPVPTSGNPTELLASRFQAWRKILKDLITYFREIQNHYEQRSKSLLKLSNVLNNTTTPPGFLPTGGLDDALQVLRTHHKTAIFEANKAKEIEEDVILALTGLRSDLNQKMKEIRSLSGDFKNSVDKEIDNTRRAVNALQECLGQSEVDTSLTTGKQDPYLLRLAVDRQVERQLDEENYLHQAYLNLEASGRELESIVVGEIQKSYNAYTGILKREADNAYSTIDELRVGPISMPKDQEWINFVQNDPQFVDPNIPVRSAEHIHYPGRNHFACQEIRAGLLERKSKYLKSYTAGWYVLSPTHLHEFKSADKTQAPVMSLYLPEQKLGSHSTEGGSSNKFILKGRQTGAMHRGHTWVFRAESHDTMMAWYESIKDLTEKSPEELHQYVQQGVTRSLSRSSTRSASSDGGVVDEHDDEPFAPNAAYVSYRGYRQDAAPQRPEPGGRFPSDLEVTAERGLHVPLSPSSASSGILNSEYAMRGGNPRDNDRDIIAAAVAQPNSGFGDNYPGNRVSVGHTYGNTPSVIMDEAPSHGAMLDRQARQDGVNPYNGAPMQSQPEPEVRYSTVPVVIPGPATTTDAQMRDPSQDSGKQAGYPPGSVVYASSGPSYVPQQPQAMNGYTAAPPVAGNGMYATVQPAMQQEPRPAGKRVNSTPHVPGEYPRNSIGAAPA